MFKLNYLLPLLCLTTFFTTFSQQNNPNPKPIKITGLVLDEETGQPLEYATLVLQSVQNPEQVTGGITGADGRFSVETAPGPYNVRVEYISYNTYRKDNQQLSSSTDLGTIRLGINVEQLEAVEVVGEKTTVEVRLDKKVYNIGKDLTTSGATISDALSNVPSVNVDVEGNISLRGNENVRILINGKPSALAGFGSTDALRQLPAEAIEKVEVITSPSARYDAEGTAGILNIVLRREKTLGFNGSANLFVGYPASSGITLNGNLRSDNYNIFSTVGYRYREAPGNAFFDNRYFSGNFDRVIEDRDYDRSGKNLNANVGMEYFITPSSSVTGSIFFRTSDGDDTTTNATQRFVDGARNSETLREEIELEDDNSYQVSFNYTKKFDDDEHRLTADFQYGESEEDKNSVIEENRTQPTPGLLALENVQEIESEREVLVQADYVLPLGENARFEAGYRTDLEREITDFRLDTLDQSSGNFVVNENLTNKFTYDENVHALYSQYGTKFGKFSFLAGLRLEQTILKGKIESDFDISELEEELGEDVDLNFDKNYLGLFPTLNLNFEIGDMEQLTLGYNRRINRPRGWFINPFPSRSSRTNIFQGNPDLDPAFSNTFDLGYLKRWKKMTFTSSVYYQRETGAFERVQEETGQTTTDGIDIIRSIPINLSTNVRIGAEAGLLYNPARWLRMNGSFNIFRFDSEGTFNGVDYGAENVSWFARLSTNVRLPEEIQWQTNAFYRGPNENAQTRTEGLLSINMAISKDILKDNGTISLNVSDLLNSRKRQSFTTTEFFTSESEFQWRVRSFNLSFIYRFNEPKKRNGNRNGRDYGDDDGEFEG